MVSANRANPKSKSTEIAIPPRRTRALRIASGHDFPDTGRSLSWDSRIVEPVPQGLKPEAFGVLIGTTKVVPIQDHAPLAFFRSPFSHADIIRLDVSKARALDGVVAVVTGDDCAHTYGVLPIAMNEYPLARGRVRYRGLTNNAVDFGLMAIAYNFKRAMSLVCLL